MPDRPLFEALSPQDRATHDAWLADFRAQWTEQLLDAKVGELLFAKPLRLALLVEMVKIDLERRYALGLRPQLDSYMNLYAELNDPQALRVLLETAESLPPDPVGSAPPPPTPSLFGKYKMEKVLGSGGMGEVWLATDTTLGRPVAIKRPHGAHPETLKRLRREAALVASLDDHPGICRIHEIGQIDGQFFLALAYLKGKSLEEVIATRDDLTPARSAEIVRRVAEILEFTHARGVLHRDLKPANIMIQSGGVPVVMDFGLGARLGGAHSQTQAGMPLGTVGYMPPEQFQGAIEEMNPTWDIYALGVTFYEMLTRRLPFTGPHAMAIAYKALHEEPPKPSSLRKDIDAELEAICLKAMARDPKSRYATMKEFKSALADYQQRVAARKSLAKPTPGQRLTVRAAFGEMTFAFVPKGTFWMSENWENAKRQVTIEDDFYLGIYPVTQGQWQAVMGKNPSWFSRTGGGKDMVKEISDADLRQFPVESVSWNDVQEFLRRLNEKNPENQYLYRLPTEAEWEYSCREGRTSQTDCSFDFYVGPHPSNDLSSKDANFDGNYPAGKASKGPCLERTSKVGFYPANRLGLHDMHGNVWEWTATSEGSGRVVRGGCWDYDGQDCTAADRIRFAPEYAFQYYGFRLARSVRPVSEPV